MARIDPDILQSAQPGRKGAGLIRVGDMETALPGGFDQIFALMGDVAPENGGPFQDSPEKSAVFAMLQPPQDDQPADPTSVDFSILMPADPSAPQPNMPSEFASDVALAASAPVDGLYGLTDQGQTKVSPSNSDLPVDHIDTAMPQMPMAAPLPLTDHPAAKPAPLHGAKAIDQSTHDVKVDADLPEMPLNDKAPQITAQRQVNKGADHIQAATPVLKQAISPALDTAVGSSKQLGDAAIAPIQPADAQPTAEVKAQHKAASTVNPETDLNAEIKLAQPSQARSSQMAVQTDQAAAAPAVIKQGPIRSATDQSVQKDRPKHDTRLLDPNKTAKPESAAPRPFIPAAIQQAPDWVSAPTGLEIKTPAIIDAPAQQTAQGITSALDAAAPDLPDQRPAQSNGPSAAPSQPAAAPDQARQIGQITQMLHVLDTRDQQWGTQLADQMRTMAQRGQMKADLVLKPKSLGTLKLTLEVQGTETQVRIVTETQAAARLLLGAEDRLGQMLEGSGLRLGDFSAGSGGQSGFGQHMGSGGQDRNSSPQAGTKPQKSDPKLQAEPLQAPRNAQNRSNIDMTA